MGEYGIPDTMTQGTSSDGQAFDVRIENMRRLPHPGD